jgi:hypothetical protein
MHARLHACGHKVEEALARRDGANAKAVFNEAFSLSEKIASALRDIIRDCKSEEEKQSGAYQA